MSALTDKLKTVTAIKHNNGEVEPIQDISTKSNAAADFKGLILFEWINAHGNKSLGHLYLKQLLYA